MKRELETRWCVSWQYVDRSQLFDAVRPNEKWRDDILDSMQPMDDHDSSVIMASVYVDSLDELRELLVETAHLQTPWGTAICVDSRDGKGMTAHAALASKDGQLGNSNLTVYAPYPEPGQCPALDKVREASKLLHQAMSEGLQ